MSVIYTCPACLKPTIILPDGCPKDFVIAYMEPADESRPSCVCDGCGQRFMVYKNPNPPGRVVMKRKIKDA